MDRYFNRTELQNDTKKQIQSLRAQMSFKCIPHDSAVLKNIKFIPGIQFTFSNKNEIR